MATQLNNWLSIDKVSGTGNAQITLTASSYTELVDRAASLKIQAQSTNAILNVRQKAFSPVEKNNNYFWIEFEEIGGVVSWAVYDKVNIDIQYSFDGLNWRTISKDLTQERNSLSMGNNLIVHLRNNTKTVFGYKINGNVITYFPFKLDFNSRAKIGGNMSSITDMYEYCLASFINSNNTTLVDASELILPWETVDVGCYERMFKDCINLVYPPQLPATVFRKAKDDFEWLGPTDGCYHEMFYGCTSLATAPELPATTLANECYIRMFYDCTSLATAPELPATTLGRNCYWSMFSNCTSLATAPVLPATTLAHNCYGYMFSNCTSLTTAPELPATTLADNCYESMFRGCTSLTTAPVLPATTLADSCYGYMFYNCTSLATAPVLPATTLKYYCYFGMFKGCTSLNYIKMLATYVSATDALTAWTDNVSSTGTFIKHPDANIPRGTSGIPNGWRVETATS